MVYKRYIKRGGKVCGPYYYKSYRDKNGKVVSKFVSGPTKTDKVIRKFNPRLNKNFGKGLQISALVFVFIIVIGLFFIATVQLNNFAKTSGFAVFKQENVVEEFNSASVDLAIKEPAKALGEIVSKNKNKRMDFDINGKNLRLYFDLLNYSEFVENVADMVANDSGINTSEGNSAENSITRVSLVTGNVILNEKNNSLEIGIKGIKDKFEELKEKDEAKIREITDSSVIRAESFNIEINKDESGAINTAIKDKAKPDYKWGYKVKLNDLKFMAKIDVTSDEAIFIYDENTLKIGRTLLSFDDLVKAGYKIRFETPTLEIPVENLTIIVNQTIVNVTFVDLTEVNITEINQTLSNEAVINVTEINQTLGNETVANITEINATQINATQINATETIVTSNETIENNDSIEQVTQPSEIQINNSETPIQTQDSGITGNIIKFFAGVTGKIIQGNAEDVKYNHTITLYIERDFTNNTEGIVVGDIVELDPTIIIEISRAEHLDSNKNFISDIYEQVKTKDNNWTNIPDGDYLRVTFEQNLTHDNDITIYARANNNSGECYDNETEILTENGWKYFYELSGNEKVATLNSTTGEVEYEKSMAYQEFDNSKLGGEMYKIEIINSDGKSGELVVSEKHKVYVGISDYLDNNMFLSPIKVNPSNLPDSDCLATIPEPKSKLNAFSGLPNEIYSTSASSSYSNDILSDFSINSSILFSYLSTCNFSEKLGAYAQANCSIMHCFVISNESRISEFCTCDENAVKSADMNFSCYFYSFIKKGSVIDNISMFSYIVRSLNSSFVFSCKSCCNSSNFNESNGWDNQFYLFVIDFVHNKRSNFVNPDLFFENRILFFSPWFNESFSNNASIKDMVHAQYSLSRICLINSVGSSSEILSLRNNSLSSSKDSSSCSSCFSELSSSINKCNSLSTFNNLLTNASSMKRHNSKDYINLSNFRLQKISEIYSSIEDKKINANDLRFLDEKGNEIKIKSIEKIPYLGKIYDVDVENDIILVRHRSQVLDSYESSDVENDIVLVRRKSNVVSSKLSMVSGKDEVSGKLLVVGGITNSRAHSQLSKKESLSEDELARNKLQTTDSSYGIWSGNSNSNPAVIEVYRKDDNVLVTKFENITNEGWHKIYLTNLSIDESHDVFDLKVIGNSVMFDYIVDPETSPNQTWNVTGPAGTAYGVAVDNNGSVYVTGTSNNDYYTIKYNATNGSQIWNASYDSAQPDNARSIVVDTLGNSYVTGNAYTYYYTIRYNSIGNQIWNVTGPTGTAYGIAVDNNESVYVTGANNNNYFTIKYNSTGGQVWNATFNTGETDTAYGIAVDNSNNVYVTGSGGVGPYFYYTVKYNSTGSEIWNSSFNTLNAVPHIGYGIIVDNQGGVYVTGQGGSSIDIYTIKYNSTNGSQIWNVTYNSGSITTDIGHGIIIDNSSNVYVTGVANGNMTTVKYNSSGSYIWNITDVAGTAYGIAVDNEGYIYVTGISGSNYYTIKYNTTISSSDTTSPVVNLISPANSTNTSNAINWFSANATDNINVTNMTLYIWNASNNAVINTTANLSCGLTATYCFTNISVTLPYAGNFLWNYLTCDNSSNCGWNATNWTINYDLTLPSITVNSPTSITYSTSLIGFNVTLNEDGYCLYSLNSGVTNITMNTTDNRNFHNSSSLTDGSYTIIFYCNDSAGNRNDSMNRSFAVSISSGGNGGGGSGGGGGGTPPLNKTKNTTEATNCTFIWECENWSDCNANVKVRSCFNKENCTGALEKPTEIDSCFMNDTIEEINEGNNDSLEKPNLKCEDWGECKASFSFEEVLKGRVIFRGIQERKCYDSINSHDYKFERRECETKNQIAIKNVARCSKNYIEVYDLNNTLISNVEVAGKVHKQLNVQFTNEEFNYCDYCYNGIKDYDEQGVDCSNNLNRSCPVCTTNTKLKNSGQKYRDNLFEIIWVLFIDYLLWVVIFIIFLVVFIIILWIMKKKHGKKKRQRKKKKRKKMFLSSIRKFFTDIW